MAVRNGVTRRGTSNGNERGSAQARKVRRLWLVETFRADLDVKNLAGYPFPRPVGTAEPACYRCGTLLTVDTVTADRIIPGCRGGTYRRGNIRPACGPCNSSTGGAVRSLEIICYVEVS